MTRWDCDVRLWRGVPCSFPAFHGWTFSRFREDDIVLSSTASVRYTVCSACYKWVPEFSRYHECTVTHVPRPQESRVATADVFASVASEEEDDDVEGQLVYVVATDENSESRRCSLCHDLMRLQFVHDIEEWVFMDCVEHDGVVLHKFCRDVAYE